MSNRLPQRRQKQQGQSNITQSNNNNPMSESHNLIGESGRQSGIPFPIRNPQDSNNNTISNSYVNNTFNNAKEENPWKKRMRERHAADGAINWNVELEDLKNDRWDWYDNKEINLEKPKINENIPEDNIDYYIESIHHDKFFKINKKDDSVQSKPPVVKEQNKQFKKKGDKTKRKRPLTLFEINQINEQKLFNKFDQELNQVISKTSSKVNVIFLFTQGVLAGMGLQHIILLLSSSSGNLENFLQIYAMFLRESFNIFHTLTFASLVGNGIKFIACYQKYQLNRSMFNSSNFSAFTQLKKNMIFSGILLFLFTITFVLEIVLASKVPLFHLTRCLNTSSNTGGAVFSDWVQGNDFNNWKSIFLGVDFIVIVWFILNIFDLDIKVNNVKILQPKVEVNYYMNTEEDN